VRLTDFDVALVLSGGAALGAYQGGVYEALHEAGLRPRHVAGSSIGAVNGALIAGNPCGERLDRLRRFWAMVAEPVSGGPVDAEDPASRALAYLTALRARVTGRPGLYQPQLLAALAPWPELRRPGLYNLGPLLRTLRDLVATAGLSMDGTRLTVHATDLATGEPVRFDSNERRLDPVHVRASTSLLPDFEPVEVEGRLLCDGGFSENLALRAVLGTRPERPLLCIAADLIAAEGRPRWTLDGMADRQENLHFASQTRALIEAVSAEQALAAARAAGPVPPVVLAHLVYRGREAAGSQKTYDYSPQAVAARWSAGLGDGRAMLELLAAASTPPGTGLVIHRLAHAGDGGESAPLAA
jgi:NTE family protein